MRARAPAPLARFAAASAALLAAVLSSCASAPRSEVADPPADEAFPGFAGEDEMKTRTVGRAPAPDRPFNGEPSEHAPVECLLSVEEGCREPARERDSSEPPARDSPNDGY
ncbi:MAG: hypothetical protein H6713_33485 [Myxococcales bacterium]|nr:hypothetical protein [Myxococcales bacterium]